MGVRTSGYRSSFELAECFRGAALALELKLTLFTREEHVTAVGSLRFSSWGFRKSVGSGLDLTDNELHCPPSLRTIEPGCYKSD